MVIFKGNRIEFDALYFKSGRYWVPHWRKQEVWVLNVGVPLMVNFIGNEVKICTQYKSVLFFFLTFVIKTCNTDEKGKFRIYC